jgi:aryl carrier-like protein
MTESNDKTTRLRYDVEQIIAQKNSIGLDVYHKFANQKLVGSVFKQFVNYIFAQVSLAIRMPGLQYDTIQESLRPFAGTELTESSTVDLIHRLLGNCWTLKENKPVRPYARLEGKEWVPVQIMEMTARINAKKVEGYDVTFKVLAGFPCTLTSTSWWPLAYCRFIAWRQLKLYRRLPANMRKREVFPYRGPLDLVTMRFSALVDYDKSEQNLRFAELVVTANLMKWNKEQMRYRARRSPKYACPAGYANNFACHTCPIGYQECRAGCHPTTYAVKLCPACNTQAYFSDGAAATACINCSRNSSS